MLDEKLFAEMRESLGRFQTFEPSPETEIVEVDPQTTETLPDPIRFDRKATRRRMIAGLQKQALTQLVPLLPQPDTELFILTNGSGGTYGSQVRQHCFELGHFIPYLVDLVGPPCEVYVSTWTMSRPHCEALLDLLDTGKVTRMGVLTGKYFLNRESGIATTLVQGLKKRGQRFKAFKNHAKVILVGNGETFCTITSSANLSSQPRVENLTLNTDPATYAFFRDEFFEVMLDE